MYRDSLFGSVVRDEATSASGIDIWPVTSRGKSVVTWRRPHGLTRG